MISGTGSGSPVVLAITIPTADLKEVDDVLLVVFVVVVLVCIPLFGCFGNVRSEQ